MKQEEDRIHSLVRREKGELLAKNELVSRSVIRLLIRDAIEAMEKAYAPYSHFKVGSALLTIKQKVYTGCNVENAAYSPSNCAERTAFFKAISEGEKDFAAIAIVGGKDGILQDYCPPCGVCRQVMREFVDPRKFLVIVAKSEEDYLVYFLEELLPISFGPDYIE
ncbi:MAG: cytidine deaminase [Clostridiales bacterium]|nr:cytidine deaminase [Clostridiales bacterium]